MLFSAFLGQHADGARWRTIVTQHAMNLNLSVSTREFSRPNGLALLIGWLAPTRRLVDELLLVGEHTVDFIPRRGVETEDQPGLLSRHVPLPSARLNCSVAQLSVNFDKAELRYLLPIATAEQMYEVRGPESVVVTDDLRLAARWSGATVASLGVHSLFMYGTIPAPLTLFKGVVRGLNGHTMTTSVISRRSVSPVPFYSLEAKPCASDEEAATLLTEALDADLKTTVPSDAALAFSGGLDSTLLAELLVRAKCAPATLVHYSFGRDGQETVRAKNIADQLGQPLTIIDHSNECAAHALSTIPRHYTYPFCDDSVIPTWLLLDRLMESRVDAVIQGEGADELFNAGLPETSWQRVFAVPESCRRVLANAYRDADMWRWDAVGSSIRRLPGAFRRSTTIPMASVALVQNGLDGIGYFVPEDDKRELDRMFWQTPNALAPSLSMPHKMGLVRLLINCDRQTAKWSDPLRMRDKRLSCPYLDIRVVRATLGIPLVHKIDAVGLKALPRRVLDRALRNPFGLGQKIGFTPPLHQILSRKEVRQLITDSVLGTSNPLKDAFERGFVERIIERSQLGRRLGNVGVFLWGLIFTSIWLTGINDGLRH
jgi:asparagine synthetase B (glutamine-hydrolysing)